MNNIDKSYIYRAVVFFLILSLFYIISQPVFAAKNDVLFGVTGDHSVILDPGSINISNFNSIFINKGPGTPSMSPDTINPYYIGAIWTGKLPVEEKRTIRLVFDSNGDGRLNPVNWSDPSWPWNRPDNGTPDNPDDDPLVWEYIYPPDYTIKELAGKTLVLTWDKENEEVMGFDENSFDWGYFEKGYDYSEEFWAGKGELVYTVGFARDDNWDVLPNNNYIYEIWVDEDDDYVFEENEAHKQLMIKIETQSVTGNMVDSDNLPVQGASISAFSLSSFGYAESDKDGNFRVSGLEPGVPYTFIFSAAEKLDTEKTNIIIPENEQETDIGTIILADAVTIKGVLKLDRNANGILDEPGDAFESYIDQWGWEAEELEVEIEAENIGGLGWGSGYCSFSIGETSKEFAVNIPPGDKTSYVISFYADGYAVNPVKVNVSSSGGDAGTIVLTKASTLTGTITLPNLVSEWKDIDAQAVSTSDPDIRFFGWGMLNPYEQPGFCSKSGYKTGLECEQADGIWTDEQWTDSPVPKDSAMFRFSGIPAGTYDIQLWVMGYKDQIIKNVTINQGEDKDLGEISMDQGAAISGSLIVQGDTTDFRIGEFDTGQGDLELWIEAWSPYLLSSGSLLTIKRGSNVSVDYLIGGLENGRYEIYGEIGNGYELTDESGISPVMVDVADNSAKKNLVLKPFEGIIRGQIIFNDIEPDLSKVAVELKRPWDWHLPKIATLKNGGIFSDGTYEITGVGTGDYVLSAGMYTNLTEISPEVKPKADSRAGIVNQRIFVENDSSSPSIFDINFSKGYSINGSIMLSRTDPPWHDFGDGRGGTANNKQDTTNDQFDERITLANDIAGQFVKAVPLDMMFMGDFNGVDTAVNAEIVDNGDETGSYAINGLAPGAYVLLIPFSSKRISMLTQKNIWDQADFFTGGEFTHHWTGSKNIVVISDNDVQHIDFTISNGFNVTGKIVLPKAQTVRSSNEWEMWEWIGHLELERAGHSFLGHGTPVFKKDFNSTDTYEFKFSHVPNGDYLVHFWTDRYVPKGVQVTVNNIDVSAELIIENGVNIVGRLVDAETGEAVTAADGVIVMCESDPPVDGSWRETFDDEWSQSYIEDDSGIKTGERGGTQGKRENSTPGKFHLSSVIPGHKYIIIVETNNGHKTGGAKNYISKVVAGIDVPLGQGREIDAGTIKLRQGTQVNGRLTDSEGNPVPGVDIAATPSDNNDGHTEAWATSDEQGYYTIYGIDPDVQYYDLIAAKRPWIFDEWGKKVKWGEKRRYNIDHNIIDPETQGTKDADFILGLATASLSGTITIPENAEFMLPFSDQDDSYPAAFILLQKKGTVYKQSLEGIEGITLPRPESATTAPYSINNIEPGTYKIIYMNNWLPGTIIDNVTFAENENKTINTTWDIVAYKISGTCRLSDGTSPGTSDISGVVCINTSDRSIIFGRLTKEADKTYSSYEVPGLSGKDTYQLVFYKETDIDDKPEVFPAGPPFSPVDADKVFDAVINRDLEPVLTIQSLKDLENADKINIEIFSTAYLSDNSIRIAQNMPVSDSGTSSDDVDGQLFIKTGNGAMSTPVLSDNKKNISFSYSRSPGDTNIEITIAVHYGSDNQSKVKTFLLNSLSPAFNSDVINPYLGQNLKLGNGDGTQIYIPAGAVESSKKDRVIFSIEKQNETSFNGLPDGITPVSSSYNFQAREIDGINEPLIKNSLTVQVQFDTGQVSDLSMLNIYHLENNGVENNGETSQWIKEETNRTLDTENNTISVEVNRLSSFIVVQGQEEKPKNQSVKIDTSDNDSSDCFIRTAGANDI